MVIFGWIQTNPYAYKLIVCIETGTLFRRALELPVPEGFIQLRTMLNKPVYDSDGLLLAEYGALKRYWINKKEYKDWLFQKKTPEIQRLK